jgi:hypothetical protein
MVNTHVRTFARPLKLALDRQAFSSDSWARSSATCQSPHIPNRNRRTAGPESETSARNPSASSGVEPPGSPDPPVMLRPAVNRSPIRPSVHHIRRRHRQMGLENPLLFLQADQPTATAFTTEFSENGNDSIPLAGAYLCVLVVDLPYRRGRNNSCAVAVLCDLCDLCGKSR